MGQELVEEWPHVPDPLRLIYRFHGEGSPAPQLWRRGKLNDNVDLAVLDDSNKAIEQMIETLRNATDHAEVGPPFEFLTLAPGQADRRQSFTG